MESIDLGEDPLALERQVCFALSVASRSVIALYRPLLEPLNLTHPQYLVMLALWGRAPQSVKELAVTLKLEPATLSPLLKRLESADYLTRRRSQDDERLLLVDLTGTGRELRDTAVKIPYRVVERLGMNVAELERLHSVLTGLISATEQAGAESIAMLE